MPDIRRNVKVSKKEATNRLPDSLAEGGHVVEFLLSYGVLHEVSQRLKVRRQGGYTGVDIFLFFTLFFSERSGERGGLAGFSARCRPYRKLLGTLAERGTLATSTSVSRFLSVVEPGSLEPLKDYLFLEASGARELLRKGSVQARDGRGFGWDIFDLDPTSMVLRQRALPNREDMPEAQRRSKGAKAGYFGRKRGEVKVTRTTLQHTGSGLWMGMWVAPGNGDFPHHRRLAFSRVKVACESMGRDTSHVLIRMDGEGGNTPTISDCMEQGLHYLARSSFYAVLSRDEVRSYLNETSWYEVEDSGSGPVRYAAELGRLELPCSETSLREDGRPYTPVLSRLVVTRHKAEEKRGAGILIDGWKYELFATDLDAQAYVASEVVTLYYGRSVEENCYKQEDRELQLDRALSYHLPGYELACTIGLFLWNLWICWGVRLFNIRDVQPEQVARTLCVLENIRTELDYSATKPETWNRIYGGVEYDSFRAVTPTEDGGFVAVGETGSWGAGEGDVWMVKTNGSGVTLFSKTFGGAGPDRAYGVDRTADGGFIIVGDTEEYDQAGSYDGRGVSRNELAHTLCEQLNWATMTVRHKVKACLSLL